MFEISHYTKMKKDVLATLIELKRVLMEDRQQGLSLKIDELARQTADDKFQIVVVGEFSRGKSTFINALLGKIILPSSVKPTTAILNKVAYSEEPEIKLNYHGKKKTETISEERFKQLTAPLEPIFGDERSEKEFKEQAEQIQAIAYAEIGYPVPFCKDGVEIIDTPGTNDLDAAREEVTNRIIPQSDAAVFILSATKILSSSEMSFLKDRLLASDIQKVFIVINFKDELRTEEDRLKVVKYAQEHLREVLGHPKIHLIAAKQALNARRQAGGEVLTARGRPVRVWPLEETGVPDFETHLSYFLQYERGAVKLSKPVARAERIIKEQLAKLQVDKISFYQNIDELKERGHQLELQIQSLGKKTKGALAKLEIELQKQEAGLMDWYRGQLKSLSRTAHHTFDENSHLSVSQLSGLIEGTIAPMEKAIHLGRQKRMKEAIASASAIISLELEKEWMDMNKGFTDLIQVEEQSEGFFLQQSFSGFLAEAAEELGDAVFTSKSLAGSILAGVGLIATGLAAGVAWLFGAFDDRKGKLKRQIDQRFTVSQAEKTARCKAEWKDTASAVIKTYKQTIASEIAKKQAHLETVIKNSDMKEDDILERLQKINEMETRLQSIMTDLQHHREGFSSKEKAGALR
ncbi:dynamin family protein [Metabacillus indicus]|uniref:dynamin family protein n=1 Tax=Metabacillus indicus TaxID=246786 RepID=UPI00049340C8|nr:dynamin family protein [Metabacillus indicus]KEZ48799.1 hypothetical protein AZ46_0218120 [Metabacillus indicus LMG 22858]